ncbi:hypothetical protein ECG_06100 [Echinococcus granulosus]|nr:hypothetical protein ECG_06100 [Echinococcus granulosus]
MATLHFPTVTSTRLRLSLFVYLSSASYFIHSAVLCCTADQYYLPTCLPTHASSGILHWAHYFSNSCCINGTITLYPSQLHLFNLFPARIPPFSFPLPPPHLLLPLQLADTSQFLPQLSTSASSTTTSLSRHQLFAFRLVTTFLP